MKKNIEIFLKIIMTISILIGICIFIISRTLGNTGKKVSEFEIST